MKEAFWQVVRRYAPRAGLGAALVVTACSDVQRPDVQAAVKPNPKPLARDLPETGLGSAGFAISFPIKGQIYYLQGPHNTLLQPDGIKDGIDLGSGNEISCKPGDDKTDSQNPVIAPISGEIVVAGDQKDRNSGKHSIIGIKSPQGIVVEMMHLDRFRRGVEVGAKVTAGDELAEMSCEVQPPKGKTDTIHLHLSAKDSNGVPVELTSLSLAGHTFNSRGDLVSPDGRVITPSNRRCSLSNPCTIEGRMLVNELINPSAVIRATATPESSTKGPVLAASAPSPRIEIKQEVRIDSATVVPKAVESKPTSIAAQPKPISSDQRLTISTVKSWIQLWRTPHQRVKNAGHPSLSYELVVVPAVTKLGGQNADNVRSEDFAERLVTNQLRDDERTMSVWWRSTDRSVLATGIQLSPVHQGRDIPSRFVNGELEIQGLSVNTTPRALSESDRANGVKERARVAIRYIYRYRAIAKMSYQPDDPGVPSQNFSQWYPVYTQEFEAQDPSSESNALRHPDRSILPGIFGSALVIRDGNTLPGNCYPNLVLTGRDVTCFMPS